MRLKDRVAIITGASQGIGRGYAFRLAQEGAKIIIADINDEKGQNVEAELKAQGYAAKYIRVDVSNKTSVQQMVATTVETFGTVDILVNNASVFSTIKMKPFEELSLEEWNKVIDVNLTGVFLCSQAVVPVMRKQKSGRIINIASGTVLWGKPYYIHYVSSKAGVAGFTRALAREVGNDNITVNTVAPGPTYTEVERDSVSPAQAEAMLKQQCIQRKATPDDLTGTVAFLCSDDAAFISGQMMLVDGGKGMH
jgi:3-oxoacyl-[acyl-carrier protein] reductase